MGKHLNHQSGPRDLLKIITIDECGSLFIYYYYYYYYQLYLTLHSGKDTYELIKLIKLVHGHKPVSFLQGLVFCCICHVLEL